MEGWLCAAWPHPQSEQLATLVTAGPAGGGWGGCWERLLSGYSYCTEEGLPVPSPLDPSKDTGFLRSWALGNLSTGTSTGGEDQKHLQFDSHLAEEGATT